MQWLLLGFFALLAGALAFVLGQNLFADGSSLTHIFEFFKTPSIAIALTLGILITAVLAALIYALESWQRRRHIAALTRGLKKDSPNAEAFAAHIDGMGQQIETAHAPLLHAWQEFEKTLIRPDLTRPADGRKVRNTVRPSSYFNVQATVEAGFNLPFWQALPNYFVGFGLLCTFLGLVSGLHFAADGVAAGGKEATDALQKLLAAATFKFFTSIAGVLSSLGLSVFIRSQTQALQGTLDRFCSALEQRLVFVTPVSVAQEQLREQQKLTATMQSFSTTLATEIADALNKRMTNDEGKNIFVTAVENLGKTFVGSTGGIGDDVTAGVVSALTAPLQTLTDAMSQLTTASSGAVDRVNEFANTYSVKITQASERFEQGIKSAADEIRAAAEAAAGAVRKGAEDAGKHFDAGGKGAGVAIDDAGKRMLDALAPLTKVLAELPATLAANSQHSAEAAKDAAKIATEVMNKGADETSKKIDEMGIKAGQVITSTGERLAISLAPVLATIGNLHDSFAAIRNDLNDFESRAGKLKIGVDDSTRALTDVSRSFQATATTLDASARPLREVTGVLTGAMTQTDAVAKILQTTLQSVGGLADAITATQQRLSTAWEQYSGRFDKTDERLAETFITLQDGIRETEEQVKVFVQGVEQKFAEAVNTLGSVVQDLSDTAGELSNAQRR